MIDLISKDDFVSKRCFQEDYSADQSVLSQQPPARPAPSPSVQKSLKRKFADYINPLPENTDAALQSFGADEKDVREQMMRESYLRNDGQFTRPEESKKENELYQVFTVVYGAYKPAKKHKDWENDAILVRKGTNLTLYCTDGDEMITDFYKKNKAIKPGEIFLVGEKQVQIGDPVEIEDFEAKRCFQAGFQAQVVEEKRPTEGQEKRVFKTVITSETMQALDPLARKVNQPPAEDDNDFSVFETAMLELPAPPVGSYEFYDNVKSVVVDVKLNLVLREHQRDGILFMYKCIAGFHPDIRGCILADEMGR